MKARVTLLHKTEADWLKLDRFIPEAGELIVYDPDEKINYARVKIGDGKRSLQELDFFTDSAITEILEEHKYSEVIDGGRITGHIK